MTGPPRDIVLIDLIAALNRYDVDFVVIGGVALLAHRAGRATKDLDIVPDPAADNLDRLWMALESIEATPLDLGDFEPNEAPLDWTRANLDFGGNWLLSTNVGRIDVVQYVAGVADYEQLRTNAVDIIDPGAGRIWFAGRDDLISMKRAAGRPQDLIDIERIEREASRYE